MIIVGVGVLYLECDSPAEGVIEVCTVDNSALMVTCVSSNYFVLRLDSLWVHMEYSLLVSMGLLKPIQLVIINRIDITYKQNSINCSKCNSMSKHFLSCFLFLRCVLLNPHLCVEMRMPQRSKRMILSQWFLLRPFNAPLKNQEKIKSVL